MTIQRTREIFGSKMYDWTDQQVLEFISQMSVVGDELLKLSLTTASKTDNTGKELTI